MDYIQDVERKVANAIRLFRDHKAELTHCGTFEVLDWRRPGSGIYAVRIVFDTGRNNVAYITGDLGCAIIRPTCKAALHDMACCFTSRDSDGKMRVDTSYFMEKFETSSCRHEWSKETFVEDFKNQCEQTALEPPENFIEDIESGWYSPVDFFDHTRPPCISERGRKDLAKMDEEYQSWIYDCGKRVSNRVIAWMVALRLASDQVGYKADKQ